MNNDRVRIEVDATRHVAEAALAIDVDVLREYRPTAVELAAMPGWIGEMSTDALAFLDAFLEYRAKLDEVAPLLVEAMKRATNT